MRELFSRLLQPEMAILANPNTLTGPFKYSDLHPPGAPAHCVILLFKLFLPLMDIKLRNDVENVSFKA